MQDKWNPFLLGMALTLLIVDALLFFSVRNLEHKLAAQTVSETYSTAIAC